MHVRVRKRNKRPEGYRMVTFPRMRRLMITIGQVSRHRPIMHGLVELDVTRARQLMREHQARTGEKLSFTAFVATCVGHAVGMNPEVQAYRTWRSQLVLFEDVDISIMVEKDLQGQKVALSHIVRAANTKTMRAIQEEIRTVQAEPIHGRDVKALRWGTLLPGFARQIFVWVMLKNPRLIKAFIGTVGLTAIGMFGDGGGWGIGLPSLHTLGIVVGGIAERPALVDGNVEAHEYLSVTLDFDHDLLDGAPAARFTQHLRDLIESGYGLVDSTFDSQQARDPGTSKKS
jgi:pyruvate/2-oxoglutarate dehydrogenase complex dihydrolipoamide acyltransferase (E2) component